MPEWIEEHVSQSTSLGVLDDTSSSSSEEEHKDCDDEMELDSVRRKEPGADLVDSDEFDSDDDKPLSSLARKKNSSSNKKKAGDGQVCDVAAMDGKSKRNRGHSQEFRCTCMFSSNERASLIRKRIFELEVLPSLEEIGFTAVRKKMKDEKSCIDHVLLCFPSDTNDVKKFTCVKSVSDFLSSDMNSNNKVKIISRYIKTSENILKEKYALSRRLRVKFDVDNDALSLNNKSKAKLVKMNMLKKNQSLLSSISTTNVNVIENVCRNIISDYALIQREENGDGDSRNDIIEISKDPLLDVHPSALSGIEINDVREIFFRMTAVNGMSARTKKYSVTVNPSVSSDVSKEFVISGPREWCRTTSELFDKHISSIFESCLIAKVKNCLKTYHVEIEVSGTSQDELFQDLSVGEGMEEIGVLVRRSAFLERVVGVSVDKVAVCILNMFGHDVRCLQDLDKAEKSRKQDQTDKVIVLYVEKTTDLKELNIKNFRLFHRLSKDVLANESLSLKRKRDTSEDVTEENRQRPGSQAHYLYFRKRIGPLWDIEFKYVRLPKQTTMKSLWDKHKLAHGNVCDETCKCTDNIPFLISSVIIDAKKKLLEQDKPMDSVNEYVSCGFANYFAPNQIEKYSREYPSDTPEKRFERVVSSWQRHVKIHGPKCSETCSCRQVERYDPLLGARIPKKRESSQIKPSLIASSDSKMMGSAIGKQDDRNETRTFKKAKFGFHENVVEKHKKTSKPIVYSDADVLSKDSKKSSNHNGGNSNIMTSAVQADKRVNSPVKVIAASSDVVHSAKQSKKLFDSHGAATSNIKFSRTSWTPKNISTNHRSKKEVGKALMFDPFREDLGFYVYLDNSGKVSIYSILSSRMIKLTRLGIREGTEITEIALILPGSSVEISRQKVTCLEDVKEMFQVARRKQQKMKIWFLESCNKKGPSPDFSRDWTEKGEWKGASLTNGWPGGAIVLMPTKPKVKPVQNVSLSTSSNRAPSCFRTKVDSHRVSFADHICSQREFDPNAPIEVPRESVTGGELVARKDCEESSSNEISASESCIFSTLLNKDLAVLILRLRQGINTHRVNENLKTPYQVLEEARFTLLRSLERTTMSREDRDAKQGQLTLLDQKKKVLKLFHDAREIIRASKTTEDILNVIAISFRVSKLRNFRLTLTGIEKIKRFPPEVFVTIQLDSSKNVKHSVTTPLNSNSELEWKSSKVVTHETRKGFDLVKNFTIQILVGSYTNNIRIASFKIDSAELALFDEVWQRRQYKVAHVSNDFVESGIIEFAVRKSSKVSIVRNRLKLLLEFIKKFHIDVGDKSIMPLNLDVMEGENNSLLHAAINLGDFRSVKEILSYTPLSEDELESAYFLADFLTSHRGRENAAHIFDAIQSFRKKVQKSEINTDTQVITSPIGHDNESSTTLLSNDEEILAKLQKKEISYNKFSFGGCSTQILCRHCNEKGGCKFGERCRFLHAKSGDIGGAYNGSLAYSLSLSIMYMQVHDRKSDLEYIFLRESVGEAETITAAFVCPISNDVYYSQGGKLSKEINGLHWYTCMNYAKNSAAYIAALYNSEIGLSKVIKQILSGENQAFTRKYLSKAGTINFNNIYQQYAAPCNLRKTDWKVNVDDGKYGVSFYDRSRGKSFSSKHNNFLTLENAKLDAFIQYMTEKYFDEHGREELASSFDLVDVEKEICSKLGLIKEGDQCHASADKKRWEVKDNIVKKPESTLRSNHVEKKRFSFKEDKHKRCLAIALRKLHEAKYNYQILYNKTFKSKYQLKTRECWKIETKSSDDGILYQATFLSPYEGDRAYAAREWFTSENEAKRSTFQIFLAKKEYANIAMESLQKVKDLDPT